MAAVPASIERELELAKRMWIAAVSHPDAEIYDVDALIKESKQAVDGAKEATNPNSRGSACQSVAEKAMRAGFALSMEQNLDLEAQNKTDWALIEKNARKLAANPPDDWDLKMDVAANDSEMLRRDEDPRLNEVLCELAAVAIARAAVEG